MHGGVIHGNVFYATESCVDITQPDMMTTTAMVSNQKALSEFNISEIQAFEDLGKC